MLQQKLRVKRELTNSKIITLVDETGVYNDSNPSGYGPPNSLYPTEFKKYIFILEDLITGEIYTHVQSDDLSNHNEFHDPSIVGIVEKNHITITAAEFNKTDFRDSIYKITMFILLDVEYEGDGFVGSDSIVNVPSAENIERNYTHIYVDGGSIYKVQGYHDSNLFLDSFIEEEFHSFSPLLYTSETLVIFNTIEDKINNKIAKLVQNKCNCEPGYIDSIVELQLLLWGIQDCIDKGDYTQAYEYLVLCLDYLNLNCS